MNRVALGVPVDGSCDSAFFVDGHEVVVNHRRFFIHGRIFRMAFAHDQLVLEIEGERSVGGGCPAGLAASVAQNPLAEKKFPSGPWAGGWIGFCQRRSRSGPALRKTDGG